MRMAISSMRSWNWLESSSPAPSSSIAVKKWASPSLPTGSCELPPSKAKRSAISGTLCSSTSQAEMPPGLFTSWIFMAQALPDTNAKAPTANATAQRTPAARAPPTPDFMRRLLLGLLGGNEDGVALGLGGRGHERPGDGAADIQILVRHPPQILRRD